MQKCEKYKQEGQDGPVSLTWLPDKFESIGLSVQENKFNIDFQDDGHLEFRIRKILAIFDLQVTLMLPTKFWVSWPLGSEVMKIDFQDNGHGCHLGLPTWTILAIFDLQVTPMLPTKFQVSWPFGSGEEAKNRFSRRRPRGHLGFLIRTILA